MSELKEPIQTGVLFQGLDVRPVWFRWHGRRVEVKRVTMRWQSTQGHAMLTHFSVTDGFNLYEITLNHQDLTWHLTKTDETDD